MGFIKIYISTVKKKITMNGRLNRAFCHRVIFRY